uniref:Uncharacterized protein n=1 Tax=Cajanus cajan TaxID=3821 RepID=A0A151T5Q1_CAJCA|nr:hypothetical protein KK1_016911 [Cajanus cajan]
MDRMFDRNNMESIKKTMQIHEDIFKHQVRELHRVYNVQKMLMEDLRKETKQKKFWTPMNGIHISHPHFLQQQQQQQTTLISYGHVQNMEVDLTLSIGGSQVKKNNNKKPYLLPLGCSDSPNGKTRELNSSLSFQSDRVGDCSDPTTPMSSSSVTFDQERKGPHWLSQGLKLK